MTLAEPLDHADGMQDRRPVGSRPEDPLGPGDRARRRPALWPRHGTGSLGTWPEPLFQVRDQFLEVGPAPERVQGPVPPDRFEVGEPGLDGPLELLDGPIGFPLRLILFLVRE